MEGRKWSKEKYPHEIHHDIKYRGQEMIDMLS
jgi:hypothetical protein